MKKTLFFPWALVVFLIAAMAIPAGAFTPENVETTAEQAVSAPTAEAYETESDAYGKLLFYFSFDNGDKDNQTPDYLDPGLSLVSGNGGSLTVLSPAWYAVSGGKFVVNGYKKWPFGLQFKFTEPLTADGKYTLEFHSSSLANVFGRFYDAPANKEVSSYVSNAASGATVTTTYIHSDSSKLSEISDVRVYGNDDGSIYVDYVKLWVLAPVAISFDYGIDPSLISGEAPATRELYKGDPLPVLSAKGYLFDGYVNADGNKVTTVPAEPTTLRAVWQKGDLLFAFDFEKNDAYGQQPSYLDESISLKSYNNGLSKLLWPSAEWIGIENGAYKIGSSQKNYALRFTFEKPITTPGTYTFKIDSKNIRAAFLDMTVDGNAKRSTYFQDLNPDAFTTLSFSYTLKPGESLSDIYAYANEGQNTTALFDNATFIYNGLPVEPTLSESISVRTANPQGLRTLSTVYNPIILENETVEIGYMATTDNMLSIYGDLLEGEGIDDYLTYAQIGQYDEAFADGLAYRKTDGAETLNYLRDTGDGYTSEFFGAFVGIPETKEAYTHTIHLRPYVKIGATCFYGAVKSLSLLDAAKQIRAADGYTPIDYVENILTVCGE